MNLPTIGKKCLLSLFPQLLEPLLGLLTKVCPFEAALKSAKKFFKNHIFRIVG